MQLRKTISLALLLGASVITLAADMPKAVKGAYDRVAKAINKCDFKTFKTFFSDDFVMVDPSGKTSKHDEFMASVEPLFKANKSGTSTHKFMGVKEHGGVVDVSFDMKVTLTGKAGKTMIHEVGVDSWKKVKGQWKMVKTVDKVFDITGPK
jgi:ketosteroid isomerase-like protein